MEKYLNSLRLQGKAENTIKTYSFHLRIFAGFLIEQKIAIDQVTKADLLVFREKMLRENKKPRTINAVFSCVRGFYDDLIIRDVIGTNPVLRQFHLESDVTLIQPLSREEFNDFLHYFESGRENVYYAFLTMATTGARVGEIAALKKGDFRMHKKRYSIDIQNAKWNSDRLIPILHKESAKQIKRYVDSISLYDEPVFKMSRRTIQTHAENFSKKTGIAFHCHKLRHTVATRLIEQGAQLEQVRYLLGHRSNAVTEHYTRSANVDVFSIDIM